MKGILFVAFLLLGAIEAIKINSTPPTTIAKIGQTWSYQVTTDSSAPTFKLTAPTGAKISNGLITFTPSASQVGAMSFSVTATDNSGSTTQSFTVTVDFAIWRIDCGSDTHSLILRVLHGLLIL